jgi:plasmid maintenance system antidote protein VapI
MAKATKKEKPAANISEQLLAEIKKLTDGGTTLYRIALDADVDQATIRRFVGGDRDLRLESAAKLATYLGLHLAKKR